VLSGFVKSVTKLAFVWYQLKSGKSDEVIYPASLLKLETSVGISEEVINQLSLLMSLVFVGTVILAVTSATALAQNVFTVVQFFCIVNVAAQIVGLFLM
jgi:hypothetical protein